MRGGRDPLRVVLDGRLSIAPTARVCTQRSTALTLIAASEDHDQKKKQAQLEAQGVQMVWLPDKTVMCHSGCCLQNWGSEGINRSSLKVVVALPLLRCAKVLSIRYCFFMRHSCLFRGMGKIGPLGIDRVAAGQKLHTMTVSASVRTFL